MCKEVRKELCCNYLQNYIIKAAIDFPIAASQKTNLTYIKSHLWLNFNFYILNDSNDDYCFFRFYRFYGFFDFFSSCYTPDVFCFENILNLCCLL